MSVQIKQCRYCKKEFEQALKGRKKKFCSDLCRWNSWNESHPRLKLDRITK